MAKFKKKNPINKFQEGGKIGLSRPDFKEALGKFDVTGAKAKILADIEAGSLSRTAGKAMLRRLDKSDRVNSTIGVKRDDVTGGLSWGFQDTSKSKGRKGGVSDKDRRGKGTGKGKGIGQAGEGYDKLYDYMVGNNLVKFEGDMGLEYEAPAPEGEIPRTEDVLDTTENINTEDVLDTEEVLDTTENVNTETTDTDVDITPEEETSVETDTETEVVQEDKLNRDATDQEVADFLLGKTNTIPQKKVVHSPEKVKSDMDAMRANLDKELGTNTFYSELPEFTPQPVAPSQNTANNVVEQSRDIAESAKKDFIYRVNNPVQAPIKTETAPDTKTGQSAEGQSEDLNFIQKWAADRKAKYNVEQEESAKKIAEIKAKRAEAYKNRPVYKNNKLVDKKFLGGLISKILPTIGKEILPAVGGMLGGEGGQALGKVAGDAITKSTTPSGAVTEGGSGSINIDGIEYIPKGDDGMEIDLEGVKKPNYSYPSTQKSYETVPDNLKVPTLQTTNEGTKTDPSLLKKVGVYTDNTVNNRTAAENPNTGAVPLRPILKYLTNKPVTAEPVKMAKLDYTPTSVTPIKGISKDVENLATKTFTEQMGPTKPVSSDRRVSQGMAIAKSDAAKDMATNLANADVQERRRTEAMQESQKAANVAEKRRVDATNKEIEYRNENVATMADLEKRQLEAGRTNDLVTGMYNDSVMAKDKANQLEAMSHIQAFGPTVEARRKEADTIGREHGYDSPEYKAAVKLYRDTANEFRTKSASMGQKHSKTGSVNELLTSLGLFK